MMKSLNVMLSMVFVFGMTGMVSAQGITDPSGDNLGVVDILAAQVEAYERPAPDGADQLLKLTIETTPNLPGAIVFEADVDNSAGTGGSISQIGVPVTPCPCKTTAGFDIAVSVYLNRQETTAGSAFCASCSDGGGPCGARREAGEWYALPSVQGQPQRALGILRGFTDPTPKQAETKTSFTFPWDQILAYAFSATAGDPKQFDWAASQDPATNLKWQVSAYIDTSADGDDVTSSGQTVFDISDWAPNGDGNKADTDAATDITYCEGNFDGDQDVDGGDAAKFKSNFGRSQYSNPCPKANAWW
jgi:hypothetical protein